jgi:hypothetical protein
LSLPIELLEEILSYVPNELIIGQTCKKFYEASSSLKKYSLSIKTKRSKDLTMKTTKYLDDEKIFQSIINSKRQFEDLRVCVKFEEFLEDKLMEIMNNFGKGIKKLSFQCQNVTINSILMLSSMKNLQELRISIQNCEHFNLPGNFRPNLPELKKLALDSCSEEIFEIFNRLPDNVLEDLKILHNTNKINGKYFENQLKLKTVVMLESNISVQFLKQQKLTSLTVDKINDKLKFILEAQDTLTELCFPHEVSQDNIRFFCNSLKSIESMKLNFHRFENILNFSDLKNLTKLKKLDLNSEFMGGNIATSIESSSLRILKIRLESKTEILAISFNCPNIRVLNITANQKEVINTCLNFFPQLEEFEYNFAWTRDQDFVAYNFPYGLEHQNLKKFSFENFDHDDDVNGSDSLDLFLLFGCLKNLEVFSTAEVIDWKLLRIILNASKLKALCFSVSPTFNKEFVDTLKHYGQSLESVHIVGCHNSLQMPSKQLLEELKKQFPEFNVKGGRKFKKWMMKKQRKPFVAKSD